MRRPAAVLPLLALLALSAPAEAQDADEEPSGASLSLIDHVFAPGGPGAGMGGAIVAGGAPPERDPVPAGPAGTVRVPRDAATVQDAVDAAEPGGLVLIAPGVYREAVLVTTPYLTIRGADRERTVLDGGSELRTGIHVVEADGVAVENLTARRYLLNGFSWTGVYGYRASYLTAHANGDNGISATGSRFGRIEHSYAAGSPEAGFAIDGCNPCDAVITDVLAEHNGLGYAGTNAGGNLAIVNGEWRANLAGIVASTVDSQGFAPQRDSVIAGNHVHHNNSTTVDAGEDGSVPFGTGIVIAGGRANRIVGNLVESQATYGIAVIPVLDERLWPPAGNRVDGNVVRDSGRADLGLGAPSAAGNGFCGNDASSSRPAAAELLYPCDGPRPFPSGGGSLSPTIGLLPPGVGPFDGALPRGERREQPGPPPGLPDMPGDPAAAPPDPAIPEEVVPGPYRIRSVAEIAPAGGPRIGRELTVMGVPLAATTWWSLLLGLYGYALPFVLYAAWVAIAAWDLVRRETEPTRTRIGWLAVVILVPFVGPLLYFGLAGSPIPMSIRLALTAGGVLAYLVFLVLGLAFGG